MILKAMTPKELYELAKMYDAENRPIFIYYICDDDYYNYIEELHECEISFRDKGRVVINISNF